MSFIITVALVSVWISVTSGITLGPSTGTGVPNTFNNPSPNIVSTVNNLWQGGTSCEVIYNTNPSNPTGDYLILEAGKLATIHCNMDQKLCEKDGPWTRIGYLNMNESLHNCPPNWLEYTKSGMRTCRRRSSGASCDSVIIPSMNIPYSEICGRVVGYQYGSTEAVEAASYRKDINSYYVDGVSITRGTPRHHVWTLMSGRNQNGIHGSYTYQCPCYTGCGGQSCSPWVPVESFIGDDWYCESGNHYHNNYEFECYINDPLWDGKDCLPDEVECCKNKPGQAEKPWFHKVVLSSGQTTTDNIEIRICSDQNKSNEDNMVSLYEIYVK